uniref:Uncharacterized protein n=1 Tax=Rhizophora mucronata TaxID=61149 RepID=A0A2P2N545_RHIMU
MCLCSLLSSKGLLLT